MWGERAPPEAPQECLRRTERAAVAVDVLFELVAEVLEGRDDRADGAVAEAQKERPKIESQMSFSVSMSSLRPAPVSSRVRILAIQSVPSRHGVHLPQDSWA